VVLCGTVGSGKTSAAQVLAAAAQGVVVSSDRTRKRLAGLAPETRAGAAPDEGIYTGAMTARVYAGLLERAGPVLVSGRVAILDASFAAARWRDAARAFAAEHGAGAWLVEVACSDAIALERLAARARAGRDASDAGPGFLATSRARHEPPGEWPAGRRFALDTGLPDWRERAAAFARDALRPAPRGS
jgi:hypothetical protein